MENLKIYVDRLKGGQAHKINETLPPDFLEVKEEDLVFEDPVQLKGEVYIANDHLILHLNIETFAYLPCSICNDAVHSPIKIKDIYLTEPLAEIPGPIFDISEEVRESILLQTPLFTECNGGKCPDRETLKKFLKPLEDETTSDDIVHFPFADLDKQ